MNLGFYIVNVGGSNSEHKHTHVLVAALSPHRRPTVAPIVEIETQGMSPAGCPTVAPP